MAGRGAQIEEEKIVIIERKIEIIRKSKSLQEIITLDRELKHET